MKTFSIQIIILMTLAYQAVSFEVTPIDSAGLLGLYSKSSAFNTIRLDPSVKPIADDAVVEKRISFPAFFEEQCAIKCLRNLNCVRYSFVNQQTCQIFLKTNYKRQVKFDKNQTSVLEKRLNCNLETCASSVYCSDSGSTCLCPMQISSTGSSNCASKTVYELSEWSAWTTCSATCDEGYTTRSKKCLRKQIDTTNNAVLKSEAVENMDWLCESESRVQVNTCKLDSCRIYGDWSSWTSCSRICGGFSTRQRDCLPGKTCDQKFLKQSKVCGLDDCSSLIIKLDRSEETQGITKRGFLKLANTVKNTLARIFTQSNDKEALLNIGRVACKEFNFNSLNEVNAVAANNLRSQFSSDAEYLNFINEQSLSGVQCNGDELSIKDCQAKANSDLKTSLFELDVECLYNGYWSSWDSWSECSVTCGAGAKRRFRLCNDPPASVSELTAVNGTSCNEANARQLTNCVMPRCESQINF